MGDESPLWPGKLQDPTWLHLQLPLQHLATDRDRIGTRWTLGLIQCGNSYVSMFEQCWGQANCMVLHVFWS